jgi:hypothetical protein
MLASAAVVAAADGRARADEPPSRAQAHERAECWHLPDWSSRRLQSSFVPNLSVGARLDRVDIPLLSANALEVYALLAWPLEPRLDRGRAGLSDAVRFDERRAAVTAEAAERSRRVQTLRERQGEPLSVAESVDAELDLEEAEAEMDALSALPDGGP